MAAILHNSSYDYGIGGASCYHNFYYVTLLGMVFMAGFLSLALARLFDFLVERLSSTHKYPFFTEFLSAVMDGALEHQKGNVLFLHWLTKNVT